MSFDPEAAHAGPLGYDASYYDAYEAEADARIGAMNALGESITPDLSSEQLEAFDAIGERIVTLTEDARPRPRLTLAGFAVRRQIEITEGIPSPFQTIHLTAQNKLGLNRRGPLQFAWLSAEFESYGPVVPFAMIGIGHDREGKLFANEQYSLNISLGRGDKLRGSVLNMLDILEGAPNALQAVEDEKARQLRNAEIVKESGRWPSTIQRGTQWRR
ncbi:MAG: hypothetical protein AAB436_03125 [Patescibacteria group bacterium]